MPEVVVNIKDIKILNKVKQTLSFLPLKAVTCRNNIFQINVIGIAFKLILVSR